MTQKRDKPAVRKPRCGRCLHRGFIRTADTPNGKPSFRCTSCNDVWQCGYDGGEYLGHESRYDPTDDPYAWPRPERRSCG